LPHFPGCSTVVGIRGIHQCPAPNMTRPVSFRTGLLNGFQLNCVIPPGARHQVLFFAVYSRSVPSVFIFKKKSRACYGHASQGSWWASIAGCRRKTRKSSCDRASSEEEQLAENQKKNTRGDKRDTVFTRLYDDETLAVQRARVAVIFVLVPSTSCNRIAEFVNRDSIAVMVVSRFTLLKRRPAALTRANLWVSLPGSKCTRRNRAR